MVVSFFLAVLFAALPPLAHSFGSGLTSASRGEHPVPVTLDVGVVRVQARFEPCIREDTSTNCDFLRNRDSEADRKDAQICNDSQLWAPAAASTNYRIGRRTPGLRAKTSRKLK